MEFRITNISEANPENVGFIEINKSIKIWFGNNQTYKTDEEEAKKVADLYVAAPLMVEALELLIAKSKIELPQYLLENIGIPSVISLVETVKESIK